jgi:hypothetical protein
MLPLSRFCEPLEEAAPVPPEVLDPELPVDVPLGLISLEPPSRVPVISTWLFAYFRRSDVLPISL